MIMSLAVLQRVLASAAIGGLITFVGGCNDAQAPPGPSSSTANETPPPAKNPAAESQAASDEAASASEPASPAETANQNESATSDQRPRNDEGNGVAEVRATGIEKSALNVGADAVDGELMNAAGETVQLSELWSKKPLVVVWYRGGWCPFCNRHLAAMQQALPEIEAAGAQVVAITPELPEKAADTVGKNSLGYVVLSDRGNALARKYGVAYQLPDFVAKRYQDWFDLHAYNGDASDELPLAATYVIDSAGKIRYAFINADYTLRADPTEVIATIKSL